MWCSSENSSVCAEFSSCETDGPAAQSQWRGQMWHSAVSSATELQKSHDLSADYEKPRSPSEPLASFYLLLNSPVVNQSLRPLPCRHLGPEEPRRSREVLHVLWLDTLCIQLCIENNPEWTGPAHSVQLEDSFYLSATHALLSYGSKLISQLP